MEDTCRDLLVQERRGTRHHEKPGCFFNATPVFYWQPATVGLLLPYLQILSSIPPAQRRASPSTKTSSGTEAWTKVLATNPARRTSIFPPFLSPPACFLENP
jgi:hypothetical protein